MIELARMLCDQAAQPAGRSAPRYFLVELDVALAGGPTPASAASAPPAGMPLSISAADLPGLTARRLKAESASVALSLRPPELISIEIRPSLRHSLLTFSVCESVSAMPFHIPRILDRSPSLPLPLPDTSTVSVARSLSVALTRGVVAGPVRRA